MSTEIKIIKNLSLNQAAAVARLHKTYLKKGVLGKTPLPILKKIYQHIAQEGILIIALYQKNLIGFIAGTPKIKDLYLSFLRKNTLASLMCLPALFNKISLLQTFHFLRYPFKKKTQLAIHYPEAELLSLVVEKPYQGTEIATLLFHQLDKTFQNQNLNQFKFLVGSNLERAHSFYKKMGCNPIETIEWNKKKATLFVSKEHSN